MKGKRMEVVSTRVLRGLCLIRGLDVCFGHSVSPTIELVFRDDRASSLQLIPNYEGQPMLQTLHDQINAAGAKYGVCLCVCVCVFVVGDRVLLLSATASLSSANATLNATSPALLVNNFSESPQLEASAQPLANRSVADYAVFTPFVCAKGGRVLGFADNRYSNGGDLVLQVSRLGRCNLARQCVSV